MQILGLERGDHDDSALQGLGVIDDPMMGVMTTIYKLGSLAGGVVGAYHGYKRHRGSIGWAIGWSLLGGLFWPIALPVAYAQGVGKPMR